MTRRWELVSARGEVVGVVDGPDRETVLRGLKLRRKPIRSGSAVVDVRPAPPPPPRWEAKDKFGRAIGPVEAADRATAHLVARKRYGRAAVTVEPAA